MASIWQTLVSEVVTLGPRVASALVIFLLAWFAGGPVSRVALRVGKTQYIDPDIAAFVGSSVKIGLRVLGAITALGTLGVNISALAAGLGLAGFALGFALKDIISNMLAGILIIIYKPFGRNDRIKVSTFEGRVARIDLRYTVLEANDQEIYVPNSMLFSNAITVDLTEQPLGEGAES